jgi:hypothetical protein
LREPAIPAACAEDLRPASGSKQKKWLSPRRQGAKEEREKIENFARGKSTGARGAPVRGAAYQRPKLLSTVERADRMQKWGHSSFRATVDRSAAITEMRNVPISASASEIFA